MRDFFKGRERPFPPVPHACKVRMRLQSWLILCFLSSLRLCLSQGPFHFVQRLPATITAFEPQTIGWARDSSDNGTKTLAFGYWNFPLDFGQLGTVTVDEKQREGQITCTFKTPGIFDVEGAVKDGDRWGPFFAAQPTGVSVVLPKSTGLDTSSTTTPSTPSSESSQQTIPYSEPPPSASPSQVNDTDASASNKSRGKIIGSVVGGIGSLAVLLVVFLLFRRRKDPRQRDLDGTNNMRAPSSLPRAVDPYLLKKPPMSSSNRKVIEMSCYLLEYMSVDHFIDRRQHEPEPEPEQTRREDGLPHDGINEPIDEARLSVVQAQIRVLMRRMERVETADLNEAPPEYVSAYGSNG
ncbi:hypothetical protein PM082_014889 [Marasmius tenuissimus]|nr:hypothetical protein PM082_014889 [Marasmius tenuissimus]